MSDRALQQLLHTGEQALKRAQELLQPPTPAIPFAPLQALLTDPLTRFSAQIATIAAGAGRSPDRGLDDFLEPSFPSDVTLAGPVPASPGSEVTKVAARPSLLPRPREPVSPMTAEGALHWPPGVGLGPPDASPPVIPSGFPMPTGAVDRVRGSYGDGGSVGRDRPPLHPMASVLADLGLAPSLPSASTGSSPRPQPVVDGASDRTTWTPARPDPMESLSSMTLVKPVAQPAVAPPSVDVAAPLEFAAVPSEGVPMPLAQPTSSGVRLVQSQARLATLLKTHLVAPPLAAPSPVVSPAPFTPSSTPSFTAPLATPGELPWFPSSPSVTSDRAETLSFAFSNEAIAPDEPSDRVHSLGHMLSHDAMEQILDQLVDRLQFELMRTYGSGG